MKQIRSQNRDRSKLREEYSNKTLQMQEYPNFLRNIQAMGRDTYGVEKRSICILIEFLLKRYSNNETRKRKQRSEKNPTKQLKPNKNPSKLQANPHSDHFSRQQKPWKYQKIQESRCQNTDRRIFMKKKGAKVRRFHLLTYETGGFLTKRRETSEAKGDREKRESDERRAPRDLLYRGRRRERGDRTAGSLSLHFQVYRRMPSDGEIGRLAWLVGPRERCWVFFFFEKL